VRKFADYFCYCIENLEVFVVKKLIAIAVALFMLSSVVAYPMAATTTAKAKTTVVKKVVKKKIVKKKIVKKKAVVKPTVKPTLKPTPKPTLKPILPPKPLPTPVPSFVPPTIPPYEVVFPLIAMPAENVLQIGQIGTVTLASGLNTTWRLQPGDPSILKLNSSISVFNEETQMFDTTWYFKATADGNAKVVFVCDGPFMAVTSPMDRTLVFYVRVGDPIVVTPPPKPSMTPLPTPIGGIKALNPAIDNILRVGQLGVVKMIPVATDPVVNADGSVTTEFAPIPGGNYTIWNYTIADPTVIDIAPDAPIAMTYPQTVWFFKALSVGATTITFTSTPINSLSMMPSQIIVFKITVIDGPIIEPTPWPTLPPKPTPPLPTPSIRPTEPPRPSMTPPPTMTPPPFGDVVFSNFVMNYLRVGQVGVVNIYTASAMINTPSIAPMPPYNGLMWTYEIGDQNVIGIADRAIPAIFPQTVWFFKGVGKGVTTITFTGNPIDPAMGMPSQVITYKVTVGEGPIIIPSPTPVPTPIGDPTPDPNIKPR